MLVNDVEIPEPNGVKGPLSTDSDVRVICRFESGIHEPSMIKITPNKPDISLDSYIQKKFILPYGYFTYQLNITDKQGITTYRCIDKTPAVCPDYSQVTISFTSQHPSPGPVRQGCAPGGSTDKPSVNPSSGPSSRPTASSSSKYT